MTDRWTAETEELVAAAKIYHRTTTTDLGCSGPERYIWRCSCGSGRDRSAPTTWGVARDEAHAHEDRAILTALADAGLLLPPGGETRRQRGQGVSTSGYARAVTAWPDGSELVGPWVPVNDGGGT